MPDNPLVGEPARKPRKLAATLWKPGQSGNPSGRPKANLHVRELAKMHVDEAVDALVAALKRPGERVQAANLLLAYGFGRPSQTHNVRMIRKIDDLTDEELANLAGDDEPLVIEHQQETED